MAPIRTERGLDRLVNFTDAAVAISITLLILPLVDLATQISHETLATLLRDHWPNFLAFIISFAVIGNLWLLHHSLFELVTAYDSALVRLNLLWLAAMTVLPFSTNVIANADNGLAGVYALYIGNIILASGVTLAMRLYLSRHPVLLREDGVGELHLLAALVPIIILVICLLLAVFIPSIGTYWLLLLLVAGPIERLIKRRRRRPAGSK
jgi:uncharacterized membrane protein